MCVDFKKAYESVRKEVLYYIHIEFGIPMKLVSLVKMCLNGTYSRLQAGRYLSDMFSIKNGLKQGNDLLLMLLNFPLKYGIRRVQVNKDGLKLNGTHQLLVHADNVNILDGSIHTAKKNTETLVVASKETDKTKCMVMCQDQNAGRSHDTKIDNSSFERVELFKYLGTTVMNQNCIQEEIKSRLKMGNAFYHLAQNLFSTSLLTKNIKVLRYIEL